MDAVQRLRNEAMASGKLATTPQATVNAQTEGGRTVVEIVPASPQVIYVPVYDPVAIWGPPIYAPYPWLYSGFFFGVGPLSFGFGIPVGVAFYGCCGSNWWGWGWGPNWYQRAIFVNNTFFLGHRFRNGNAYLPGMGRIAWQHDPAHRWGVPYPNRQLAGRFGNGPPVNLPAIRQRAGTSSRPVTGRPAGVTRSAPAGAVRTAPVPRGAERSAPGGAARTVPVPPSVTRSAPTGTVRTVPAPRGVVRSAPGGTVRTVPVPPSVTRSAPVGTVRTVPAPMGVVRSAPGGTVRTVPVPPSVTRSAPGGAVRTVPGPVGIVRSAPAGAVRSMPMPSGGMRSAPSGVMRSAPSGGMHSAPSGGMRSAPSGGMRSAPSGGGGRVAGSRR
jgi:hypothetical protein